MRSFRRFSQYSVICYFWRVSRLALTNVNKKTIFYRYCICLPFGRFSKKSTEVTFSNFAVWRYKNQKTTRGSMFTRALSTRTITPDSKNTQAILTESSTMFMSIYTIISPQLPNERIKDSVSYLMLDVFVKGLEYCGQNSSQISLVRSAQPIWNHSFGF